MSIKTFYKTIPFSVVAAVGAEVLGLLCIDHVLCLKSPGTKLLVSA